VEDALSILHCRPEHNSAELCLDVVAAEEGDVHPSAQSLVQKKAKKGWH